jgi:hypothetical protein
MSPGTFESVGEHLRIQACLNGRMRYAVSCFERTVDGDIPLSIDVVNLAKQTERETFVGSLPAEYRDEAAQLCLKIVQKMAQVVAETAARASPPPLPQESLEPWHEPVDGTQLLSSLTLELERYVVLPPHTAAAIALWIVHTFVTDVTDYTPYLLVTSPTRQCGKSTLLELLQHLAFRAVKSDGYTPAALYRRIDHSPPTFLLDELDTRLHGDAAEALRGVLNSGFHRQGKVTICVGDKHEPTDFRTFCPKVLAGIRRPWDTVVSRSIPVQLQRATKEELRSRKKIRGHLIAAECAPLYRKAMRWAFDIREGLLESDPHVPECLDARQADIWRPLLAIADCAAGDWPQRARLTAAELHGVAGAEVDDGVLLLKDVRDLLNGENAIFTERLIRCLCGKEDRPWAEYRGDRPITARGVSRLLEPFGVRPTTLRIGEEIAKGYKRDQLLPAFVRYLS